MEQLTITISELQGLRREIPSLYQNMQDRLQDLTRATTDGRGDFSQLAQQSQSAIQAYSEVRARTVQSMDDAYQMLCTKAQQARDDGVVFPENVAEVWASLSVEEYTPDRITADLDIICQGLSDLRVAIERFEDIQLQISEALTELKWEIDRLERLEIVQREDRFFADGLIARIRDINEPREPLLQEINSAIKSWRDRSNLHVQQLLTETIDNMLSAYERLRALGAEAEEDHGRVQALNDQHESPDERLLELARQLHHDFTQRALDRHSELQRQIDEQIVAARQLRATLDESMNEAIMLDQLLEEQAVLHETQLLDFIDRLTQCIEAARHAGINTLRRYEQTSAHDEIDETQAHLLGTAMLASAHIPEMYSEKIWKTGEDILLRMLFADLDANNFYHLFGYRTIARAFKAAMEQAEFVKALIVFSTGFLPPTIKEEADQVVALLEHPEVNAVIEGGLELSRSYLTPEQLHDLSTQHRRGIITFLEHADVVGLPVNTRLQWLASLLNQPNLDADLHHRACRLLLQLLLASGRYLSLYYALLALGEVYPDFWQHTQFRPMLFFTIKQAIGVGADGKEFLVDLYNTPGPGMLAEGDFDSELLLAATAHHLDIRWGCTSLLPFAWSFWERMSSDYPTLGDILLRQLQYESLDFDVIDQDPDEIQSIFTRLVRDINARLPSPQHQGVKLAIQIHNYYAQHYIGKWLDKLMDPEVTVTHLDSLASAAENLAKITDLVDACPLQEQAPEFERVTREPLKTQVNTRLSELLGMLQLAIDYKRRMLKIQANGHGSLGKLSDDIRRLYERSEIAYWSMHTLLEPLLPNIVSPSSASLH